MSNESSESYVERVIARLEAHGVRYLLIGGQAEYLFGSPRVTVDVDICYERSAENLKKLATALQEIHARLRGVSDAVPFVPDARALRAGSNFTFETDLGPVDILGYVEPIGEFKDLAKNSEEYDIRGLRVRTISLDDLIRVKQHIKRFKDSESLIQLLAIKRLREQEKQ